MAEHEISIEATVDDRQPSVNIEKPALIDEQWLLGVWAGRPRLECIWCRWDTLEGMGVAFEHKLHCPRCGPTPIEHAPAIVQAYDRYGNPIEIGVDHG